MEKKNPTLRRGEQETIRKCPYTKKLSRMRPFLIFTHPSARISKTEWLALAYFPAAPEILRELSNTRCFQKKNRITVRLSGRVLCNRSSYSSLYFDYFGRFQKLPK